MSQAMIVKGPGNYSSMQTIQPIAQANLDNMLAGGSTMTLN